MTNILASCRSDLRPAAEPRDNQAAAVRYSSSGMLLVVDPNPDQLDLLAATSWPDRMLILREIGQTALKDPMHVLQGRIDALSGWLGRFQVRAVDAQAVSMTGLSAKGSGFFDLVIDCGNPPLLDCSVLPFGYFQAGSVSELEEALGAAQALIGSFEKPKYFHYEAAICAHHAYGQTGCTRCLDVCGANAIQSGGAQIEINPYLCQGCGSCTLACPTGALSFTEPERSDLLESLRELAAGGRASRLVVGDGPLAAERLPEDSTSLLVRPLTAFGEELWLVALALGFRQIVLHATTTLEPRTAQLLDGKIETLQSMLPALGHGQGALALSTSEASLSALLSTPIGDAAAPAERGNDPDVGSKRALFNDALDRVQALEPFAPIALPPGTALGEIVIDQQRCTLCSSCAKLCPTGAIDYSERSEPGTALLSFLEASCVQCGICESACPESAITLHARLAPAAQRRERKTVASSTMAGCADCGVQFAADKLLRRTLERLREHNATAAALEQAIRCPPCRARRIG